MFKTPPKAPPAPAPKPAKPVAKRPPRPKKKKSYLVWYLAGGAVVLAILVLLFLALRS
jgi:hypothetical protein